MCLCVSACARLCVVCLRACVSCMSACERVPVLAYVYACTFFLPFKYPLMAHSLVEFN